jgi:hypothetical protein
MQKTFEDFIDSSDYIQNDKKVLKEIFAKGRESIYESERLLHAIEEKTK